MKKIIIVFVMLCAVIGSVFFMIQKDSNQTEENQFLVASNSNHIFDATFENDARMQFSLPFYNPAKPIEEINALENLETVKKVVPFYPVFLRTQNDNGVTTFTYYENDKINHKKRLEMPINYMDNEMHEMRLMPVFNYDQFYQVQNSMPTKTFLKEFDSESGIYISSALYEQMKLDKNVESLTIEVQVQVPVKAKMQLESYDTHLRTFEIMDYRMIEFETIDITLDVQGVFQSQNNSFCLALNIIVPYEITEAIYKEINYSSYELGEGEMYWEPNCYIVTCQDGVQRNDFGYEASSKFESMFVKEWNYGQGSFYHYLYTEDDVLINQ